MSALVGRDAELRVFERALGVVGGGRSSAVGIVGEPGIGKSRLLGELGGRAAERGHVVLAGRAAELMPGEAHQPFQEVPDEFNARVDAFWREVDAGV